MRRPGKYVAGALLATGVGLALAGPASAATVCHHPHGWEYNQYDRYDSRQDSRQGVSNTTNQNVGNRVSGFNLLSNNSSSSNTSSLVSSLTGGLGLF